MHIWYAHCTLDMYIPVSACFWLYLRVSWLIGAVSSAHVHVCRTHTCLHTWRYIHICIAQRQCTCVCIFVMNTCTCAFLKAAHICMYLTVSDCISQCISVCICMYLTVFCCHIYSHMHRNCGFYCPKSTVRSSGTHENQSKSATVAAGVRLAAPAPAQSSPNSVFIILSHTESSCSKLKAASTGCSASAQKFFWDS